MKVLVRENGVVLVGKAWEIREKLKEYCKMYDTVQEWISLKESK
ncbi:MULTISPECIES: Z-ring formation inhibitor MciZ [Bacillus]|nr:MULTISPECIES: Z-ring formation inhibitor MciZ [Bacillus]